MAITTLQELQKATEARQQLLQGQDTGTAPTTNTGGEVFYRDTSVGTQPVEAYNPYTTEAPQSVIDAQNQYNQVNIATQEYADKMTARIIADRNGYITDDNYQGMLNKTYTNQIYDYLKRANNGADDSAWGKSNPEDDLFSKWLPDWIAEQDLRRRAKEAYDKETPVDPDVRREQNIVRNVYNQTTNQAQREIMNANEIEHGNWNLMSWWDKAKYLIVPGSNATQMDAAPEWAKWIQNLAPAAMASGAGAMIGSLIPIPGAAIIGAGAVGVLTYVQGVTGVEIPVLSNILEWLDKPAEWFEQGQGALGAAITESRNRLKGQDADLFDFIKTTYDVLKENPYLFEVGKYAYEASADLGFDDIVLGIRNAGAKALDTVFGTNIGQRDISEVSRANIGRSGLEETIEGSQGYSSLINTYAPVFEGLVNEAVKNGMTEKEAIQFAHQNMQEYLINYMGTSGLGRDLVAQSVADPMNFVPYVSAKLTEGIGKATGNVALQNAGAAAVGNPIIDALPPGVQQLVEASLSPLDGRKIGEHRINVHGSQGLDTIKQTYVENLRGTVDVSSMSKWQKHLAGIDNDGKIKDYQPFKPTGNAVVDYIRKFFAQTEDSKMLDLSQTTTDFLGSVLFNQDIDMGYVPELVAQATGFSPIGDDSPLANFRNTALLNTLQDAFKGVDQGVIDGIRADVQNYRNFNGNRAVLDSVAQQLGMSVDDIFKALDNSDIDRKDPKFNGMTRRQKQAAMDANRQELFKRIRDAGLTVEFKDGDATRTLNADQIIKKIDVFRTIGPDGKTLKNHAGKKQYSQTYLKANFMERISSAVDDWNLKKFGIKPDSWATRLSNLNKAMQSIALLNFSTSYQVNNFLNNLLTRSVAGVGGIDTDFVNTVNAKRGLSFSRDSKTWQDTSNKIKQNKKAKDTLQKFDDMFNNVKDKAILKGVNNLDVEGIETNAAFNIGANRYWSATWANNIPEMPQIWKTLGITEDMNQQIFKVALDSANLAEFKKNLMGEVLIPKAESTLAQMLANNYNDNSAKYIRDFFATKPWVADFVDSFMETGDPRLIKKGFEKLINKLTNEVDLQNVVQLAGTFDEYRNTFAGEGVGTAADALEVINDLYSQMWIKQTKENGTLFLDRVVGAIAEPEFDQIYKAATDIQTNDYNIAKGYTIMALGGMIAGLGIDSDVSLSLLSNAMSFYDLGEQYVAERHRLYQQHKKNSWTKQDVAQWIKESTDLCSKTLDAQLNASREMHKTYIDYLRSNLADSWTGRIDAFEKHLDEVLKLKEAENAAEIKDLNKRLVAQSKGQRAKRSIEQEKPRVARKQAIHDAYQNAARELKAMEGAMPKQPTHNQSMSLETTLKLQLLGQEAQNMAKRSGEFLKKYKDGADPSKPYQPIDFSNSRVNTSFYEDGQKQIIADAIKNGTDFVADAAHYQTLFTGGDAVPLGAVDVVHAKNVDNTVYIPSQHKVERLKMTDHYELLNPNANLKASEYVVARSKPFKWGNETVNAGVYHNGVLLGYITQGMQETVVVDGKTFPVIGIAKESPDTILVLVQDKPVKVTPGKPKGIEYSIYAKENYHPSMPGTTPAVEPWGKTALESSAGIREVIRQWSDQAVSDLSQAQQNGSLFGKLNDAQRQAVYEWMDGDLRQAYNSQRYQTQRYGETMVDAALLNYNKRYGFDNLLTAIMPYQFWMTRSVANWGKRMISQPAWFSMYARLENLIEKNKKDFLPTRLEGLVGIPMPNMGDGMGSSFYFDINNVILPFQQFYKQADYYISNLNTIHQNTLTKIENMYTEGQYYHGRPITEEEYDQAMLGKGALYDEVFKEVQATDEADTSMGGLMGTFFGPPVWFDMARKHLEGKDKAISYSPMFRTGNLIKAVGDETPLESVTNVIGSAMQLPENLIRRATGIESNPDGNYADYGIVSNIANMLTDLEISENEALNAIAEGPGNKIYEEALYRYRQTQAYRMQGGALATEIGQSLAGNKSTSVGQLAGSALVSLFGGKTYADGERTYREHQDLYRKIVQSKDEEAYKEFWKKYPDHSVHYYSYEDDPEKRLHKVLLDNLQNAYYALPYDQQVAAQRSFGSKFTQMFVNKETRATDYLDDSEIIEWTRALKGNVPNLTDEQITGPKQQAIDMVWYVDSVQADYERYKRDFDRKFPGFDTVEQGYYACDPKYQARYKAENPMLQQGWDYERAALRANPKLAVYLNDRSAQYKVSMGQYGDITQALMSKLNDWTLKQLQNHINYGWALNPSAEHTLKTTYTSLRTNVPYETWLKSLLK